jgi:tetratricopeptide (TPR) repeat protein
MIKKDLLRKEAQELSAKEKRIIVFLLLLLTFIFYGSTLQNDYSIDDLQAYTQNSKATNGLKDMASIFEGSTFQYNTYSFGYRPLSLLSFAAENHFFGVNARVSHAINLLLYWLICSLSFYLLLYLFPTIKAGPLLASIILFLIMPVHAEIVNNVKCRDELLMMLMGLLAALFWYFGHKKWYYLPLVVLFLLASVLSKKSGFIFLGVLPVLSFYFTNGKWKKTSLYSFLLVLPYILFRIFTRKIKEDGSFREYSVAENPLFGESSFWEKFTMSLESLGFYLGKMTLPFELVSYYGFDTIPYRNFGWSTGFYALLFMGLLILGAIGFFKRKPFALGIVITLGALLPFLNFLVPLVGVVAERFSTIASLGWALFLVFGAMELLKLVRLKKVEPYLGLLLLTFGVFSFIKIEARNKEWKDTITVLEADVEKEPNSCLLHFFLANNYYHKVPGLSSTAAKMAMGKKGVFHCERSIELFPSKGAYNTLGGFQFRLFRQFKEAEKSYQKALELDAHYSEAWGNMGWLMLEQKQTTRAVECFEKAIEEGSMDPQHYLPLVRILVEGERFQEAEQWNAIGLERLPGDPNLLLNKANILYFKKEYREALRYYELAIEKLPGSPGIAARISELKRNLQLN